MPDWNELYRLDRFAPDDPHPLVVRALAGQLNPSTLTLDLGCGAGRHLSWLARARVPGIGIDESDRGLRRARKRLVGLPGTTMAVRARIQDLPLRNGSFDVVIAIHSIYHGTRAAVCAALDEITRVLRPGGTVALTLLSDRTWKYGDGQMLEPGTYVQQSGPESGVAHHFLDEAGVLRILHRFTIRSLELDEFFDEENSRHSHWEVVARR